MLAGTLDVGDIDSLGNLTADLLGDLAGESYCRPIGGSCCRPTGNLDADLLGNLERGLVFPQNLCVLSYFWLGLRLQGASVQVASWAYPGHQSFCK